MPGSVSSNVLKNVVDTYRMYVSEVGVNPVLAAMLVIVFSYFKCYKELMAKLRWLRMSRESRGKIRESIDLCWNCEQQEDCTDRVIA